MNRRHGLYPWLVVLGAIILAFGIAWAQEHPEHPEQQEHPEHPQKEPVTIDGVADFIEKRCAEQTAEQGGWMKIHDEQANADLSLQLDKVHRERLAKTADKTYFVCADFKTPEGKTYDLDFWVSESEQGLSITETMVHKEEGKPRYTWYEEGGIWTRKPM